MVVAASARRGLLARRRALLIILAPEMKGILAGDSPCFQQRRSLDRRKERTVVADVTADAGTISDKYHFLVRRLHSLSGIVPVGVFLCIHLSINASIIAGPRAFQYAVDQIHKLNNLGILKAVELLFIFAPIAFHAVVGS